MTEGGSEWGSVDAGWPLDRTTDDTRGTRGLSTDDKHAVGSA